LGCSTGVGDASSPVELVGSSAAADASFAAYAGHHQAAVPGFGSSFGFCLITSLAKFVYVLKKFCLYLLVSLRRL
jgi:hypothetical protein